MGALWSSPCGSTYLQGQGHGFFVDADSGKEVGVKMLSKGRERRQFLQADLESEGKSGLVLHLWGWGIIVKLLDTTTNSPKWRFSGRTTPPSQIPPVLGPL